MILIRFIAAWIEDYNRERPHPSLGYATLAAFAAELQKQWPASLRPAGSGKQPISSTALMLNKGARLQSQLEERWGSRNIPPTTMHRFAGPSMRDWRLWFGRAVE